MTGGGGGGGSALCVGPFEACGISCMPMNSTCCDGFYCPMGQKCAADKKCVDPNEDDSDEDDDDNNDADDDNETTSGTLSSTNTRGNEPAATGGNASAAKSTRFGRQGLIMGLAICILVAI